jgi:Flp pilus assembly pilin Flp
MAARHRIGAQEGQALIEYAIILGALTLILITSGVLHALGLSVSGLLGQASTNMTKVLNS